MNDLLEKINSYLNINLSLKFLNNNELEKKI